MVVLADRQPAPRWNVARTRPAQRWTATGRPVAAGGWRRATVGLLVGAATGALALLARRRGG